MANHAKIRRSQDLDKIITLKDVAEVAGVTSNTVSQVIKGRGRISTATREKVLRIVEELNYTPNQAARSLSTGRTGVVAVISGELNQIYYANMVHLLEEQLTKSGYEIKLMHSVGEIRNLINATKSSAVDGVIVSNMHGLSKEPDFLNSHLSQRCVFLDTHVQESADYVYIDLRAAVKESLERMIAVGRKRIAYVGVSDQPGFNPSWAAEDRLKTYLEVMERTGRPYEFINSRPTYSARPTERIHALRSYFETHGCPEGIFCLHGDIAMLTSRALRESGFKVPQDALIVSGDDAPVMEYFDVSLSAITHPLEEACATAWQFLQYRLDLPQLPLQSAVCKGRFVLRESMEPNS